MMEKLRIRSMLNRCGDEKRGYATRRSRTNIAAWERARLILGMARAADRGADRDIELWPRRFRQSMLPGRGAGPIRAPRPRALIGLYSAGILDGQKMGCRPVAPVRNGFAGREGLDSSLKCLASLTARHRSWSRYHLADPCARAGPGWTRSTTNMAGRASSSRCYR